LWLARDRWNASLRERHADQENGCRGRPLKGIKADLASRECFVAMLCTIKAGLGAPPHRAEARAHRRLTRRSRDDSSRKQGCLRAEVDAGLLLRSGELK